MPNDPVTSACRACTAAEDRVGRVCLPKCGRGQARDASGQCECTGGLFPQADGSCGRCEATYVWSDAKQACVCPPGTDPMRGACMPACAPPMVHDLRTGACRICDPSTAAFAVASTPPVCVQCSFDEELDPGGRCACRGGYHTSSNGHCVR